jgi:hypothetical protein
LAGVNAGRVIDLEVEGVFSGSIKRIWGWPPPLISTSCRMQAPSSILSQITAALYPSEFSRCAELFPMQRPPRGLTAYDQFLALSFGQLTYRESLRDIVCCLQAKGASLYHLGFRGRVTRTNLAYANHHRDWRVFRAAAQVLMRRAARLYQEDPADPDLPRVAFALDSSLIALSLELFPWGFYARSSHSAMKLHLMLSLQGNLPAWAALTEADFPDMKVLDQIPVLAGAYYIMDRGYLDFLRLFGLHRANAFFVVRNRRDVKLRVVSSRPVDKSTGLRCDQTICLTSNWSVKSYPEYLRKIVFYDSQNDLRLVLLTNQFQLPALVITELYRHRWQIELFFKWIKQHLRLRAFYGRTQNAVRSQVWSAICAYLMVAIMKKRLNIRKSLNEILQIVSVRVFEELPLAELLNTTPDPLTRTNPHLYPQKLLPLTG